DKDKTSVRHRTAAWWLTQNPVIAPPAHTGLSCSLLKTPAERACKPCVGQLVMTHQTRCVIASPGPLVGGSPAGRGAFSAYGFSIWWGRLDDPPYSDGGRFN